MMICMMPGCQTTAGCKCQPTPWPTATELALEEAKRHIAILTAFWMENPGWTEAANAAREFIAETPTSPTPKGQDTQKAPTP